jgi:predicted  nucleic acid-binding Zn-ribbon protein
LQQELDILRQLQEFDLEIQEIEERAAKLRVALEDITELHDSLAASLEAQKEQLDETKKLMRQKDRELKENEERYIESKEKLNKVSNAREYNALEKEMDALRKLRAQLEEEYEQLKDAVADSEDDVEEKKEKVDNLAAEMKSQQKELDKEEGKAEKRAEQLHEKREKLKTEFAEQKNVIRRYEFNRDRMQGKVIVDATDGVCSGCNMKLPPQMYNELIAGEKMVQCPTCKRILFYEPEEEDEEEGEKADA